MKSFGKVQLTINKEIIHLLLANKSQISLLEKNQKINFVYEVDRACSIPTIVRTTTPKHEGCFCC